MERYTHPYCSDVPFSLAVDDGTGEVLLRANSITPLMNCPEWRAEADKEREASGKEGDPDVDGEKRTIESG